MFSLVKVSYSNVEAQDDVTRRCKVTTIRLTHNNVWLKRKCSNCSEVEGVLISPAEMKLRRNMTERLLCKNLILL